MNKPFNVIKANQGLAPQSDLHNKFVSAAERRNSDYFAPSPSKLFLFWSKAIAIAIDLAANHDFTLICSSPMIGTQWKNFLHNLEKINCSYNNDFDFHLKITTRKLNGFLEWPTASNIAEFGLAQLCTVLHSFAQLPSCTCNTSLKCCESRVHNPQKVQSRPIHLKDGGQIKENPRRGLNDCMISVSNEVRVY